MARTRKPRPLSRVEPGDLFAMPLADGRWGACVVLRKSSDAALLLVQTSAWIGDAPPSDLSDPLLTTPLVLTHHAWGGDVSIHWVDGPVPEGFVSLGRVPLGATDAATDSHGHGSWEGHRVQPLMQWRWDHEREAVLAEDEVARQQREAASQEWRFGYRRACDSLRDLRQRTAFPGWASFVEPADLRLSRRIVRDLIDELIALEHDRDEVTKLDAFRRAVGRFNETDFIMTEEREGICEMLDQIADAAGLHDHEVSAWRDW